LQRFEFGKNWTSFSDKALSEERIAQARNFLFRLIPEEQLRAGKFLDVGFGQGLTLCLAKEAGAEVFGIDVDPDNLQALERVSLKLKFDHTPHVKIRSILDENVVADLSQSGPWDVVHSWGVLHHTGDLWKAAENCTKLVAPNGRIIVAVYRTHWSSSLWRGIKWSYNQMPSVAQKALVAAMYPVILIAKFLTTWENPFKKERGMEFFHDVVDWVGGYPYEFATADEVRQFFERLGFKEEIFFPAQVPTGCNEFVFQRIAEES
jgi:SAM-dependent methyltransferase